MMESLADIFKEESLEILAELESSLLELEEVPDDIEVVSRIFRSLHTIKGSGAMVGFTDISAFAHEVETIFDDVRTGRIAVTSELINLTLAARDQIKGMIEAHCGSEGVDAGESERVLQGLRRIALGGEAAPLNLSPPPPVIRPAEGTTFASTLIYPDGDDSNYFDLDEVGVASPPPAAATPSARPFSGRNGMITYRIRFHLSPEIFSHGVNPVCLLRELDAMGDCRTIAQVEAVPELEDLDPERCYLFWDVILSTDRGIDAIKDVFIFVADDCRLQIETVDADWIEEGDYKRLGEILVERGDISSEELLAALAECKRLGQILVEKKIATPGLVEAALAEQRQVMAQRETRKYGESSGSIRVKSDKLDALVNLIGELVTVQARLTQLADKEQTAEILSVSEEVERLTWDLRDQVLTIRMLPIGATFSKLKRLVHDLSRELGKQVQLVTEGAETELDKTVIEKLGDPLVHLIRNCIDHGLESPDERKRLGKNPVGTVTLRATHVGANVVLSIRDDGAGIDKAAIRRKAEAQGLIAPGAEIADKELFQLILAPGFSTASTVTEVSGRGVGMDVVRQAVDALRGDIEIGSIPGVGTTFTIKLPLTLAIIDGLLVRIGCEDYVLPLSAVEECIELTSDDDARTRGRNIVNVRGEIVPFIRLREQFVVEQDPPGIQQIVIADVDGDRVGFVVDYVVGEHQTVIKNLGKLYKGVNGISGATILGDGRVALILDLQGLKHNAKRDEDALTDRM